IINGYGPTEATICSTLYNINTNLIQDRITPIGQPVINSSIVLLDESNQLTPPGAIGELCIGGTGLAQDYCNNPTLTAQNFIDWSYHKNSMRIYKTGDLARYLEDGSLQFAGRVDSQIKLRGYRIELGEIETIIRQQSCIADAIVIINQHKQIVAYVLADNESNYDQTQLENTLKNHLPEYMLPTAIILMDQFPTTNNGKIDRQRLQQKELPLTSREQFIAARSAHEKLIADIWQTVLSIDPPSIHDNFFALGGDSILSIQVVAKLKTHGLILNPKQFFQSPTIAELARVIGDDVETNSAEQGVVTGKTVLHPIQHWFFNQQFKQPEHWNQSVLLKMNQPLVVQQLKHIVAQLLEHHDNLRACFQQNEATKQWSQEIKSLDNDLPLMMIDGTHWSSEELKDCLASTATIQQQALKLTDESLIQFIYFKLADELSDRLLIIAHHLIIDGVSWRILLEDCHQLINNEIQGKNLKLAEKTHSVQEWNQLLAKYSLAAECQYWKNNLSNSAITSIPKDNSTETNLEADIAIVEQKISKEQTHQLVHQANQVFFTQTSELLLAALALWQSEATNDPMLYVSVEGHGRELNKAESSSSSAQTKLMPFEQALDISRTIGWFTSLFPFLFELSDESSSTQIIKDIKEKIRQTSKHQFSYQALINHPETASQLPKEQPEISFNYLGQFHFENNKDAHFSTATESTGIERNLQNHRPWCLDWIGSIVNGELNFKIAYNRTQFNESTIISHLQRYFEILDSLVADCLSAQPQHTVSDFSLVQLSEKELNHWQKNKVIDDVYPLSPLQKGLFFHGLEPTSEGLYNQQISIGFEGSLNIEKFQSAWQEVMDAHSILRTDFVWGDMDDPVQRVHRQVKLPWKIEDWSDYSADEQNKKFAELLSQDKQQAFDLAIAPLMRMTLIKLNDDKTQWLWTHHHLLIDGWSLPILLKQCFERYWNNSINPIPVYSYRDYIEWISQQDQQQSKHFWTQYLKSFAQTNQINLVKAELSSLPTQTKLIPLRDKAELSSLS
ncbi:MAG: AMP-binding protein, partial [Methylococcales bacterium]|nr:AMP-binding protein [Methylococcales bacterium]